MKRANILIFDDDLFFQKVLGETLTKKGFNVFTAGTFEEAKEVFKNNFIDIVLLDLILKEGNGLDYLPEFLKNNTSVVVLTGHASMDSAISALKMGAADYLRKPVSDETLFSTIEFILEKKREGKQEENLKAIKSKLERLELLDLISRAINSTNEINTLLKMSLNLTTGFIGAEGVSLFLKDEKTEELVCYLASGSRGEILEGQRMKKGAGIAGWVADNGVPLLVNDVSKEPRFNPEFDRKTGFKTHSILAVPLRAMNKTIGVMEVINKKDNEKFTMDDQQLLYSLANHLAIAVENAKITEELRKTNELLEQKVRERTKKLEDAITQLTQAQKQLIHTEKMASLGIMAAGIAHEINNPLSFIQSNLTIIKDYLKEINIEDRELSQEILTAIDESLEGVQRIGSIIKGLKGFARADEGKLESVDINQLIDEVLRIIWNEVKYKAEVIKEFGNVPGIVANRNQLAQVLVNLIVNASQAIEKKGKIIIRTYLDEDRLAIDVEDTGCGIPPENLKRIFDPFFTTKPVGKGTGLGLSITLGIVQNHGGDIKVHSEVGRGTKFTVYLPLSAEKVRVRV
jgi:signal transduction histidine kinase/DNA-binding response OmpR family regulator